MVGLTIHTVTAESKPSDYGVIIEAGFSDVIWVEKSKYNSNPFLLLVMVFRFSPLAHEWMRNNVNVSYHVINGVSMPDDFVREAWSKA